MIFHLKRQAVTSDGRPPLTQIGIRHANLLWKNSDKNLASLQESKFFSVSPQSVRIFDISVRLGHRK